jgi:hypothetical protein
VAIKRTEALDAVEARYQSVTHGGVKQSLGPAQHFPGGKDVHFDRVCRAR